MNNDKLTKVLTSAVAYVEVDRITLDESKTLSKVVKKVILLYMDIIKNNFNDFSFLLRPCATYPRYATDNYDFNYASNGLHLDLH